MTFSCYKKKIFLFLSSCILWGCGQKKPLDICPEKTAASLFEEGLRLGKEKKYQKAGETFELIQRTHPESPLVQKGQIYASWCYLQNHNGAEALGALELMENIHPGCPYMDLVFYLKALIYYEKRLHIRNNQEGLIWCLRVMKDILKFFPQSVFASKAKREIPLLEHTIFYHDLLLAYHFMKRSMYVPALMYINNALVYYPKTPLYAEGLYYGMICAMGLDSPLLVKEFWLRLSKTQPCFYREEGEKFFKKYSKHNKPIAT